MKEREVSRFEDRYPDKENTVKDEVPAEEKIVIPDTLSSKSPSSKQKVWKPKVKSNSNHSQNTTPMAPSDVAVHH